jgi:hypothetical protein
MINEGNNNNRSILICNWNNSYQVSWAYSDVEKVGRNVKLIGLIQLGSGILASQQSSNVGRLRNLKRKRVVHLEEYPLMVC